MRERWLGLARRLPSGDARSYLAAVAARTGARALWGFALPAVLAVEAYGRYSVLATVAVMAVQLAVLGAPQTLVQNAGRRVPTLGLLLHAIGVGAAVMTLAALLAPLGGGTALPAVAAAVSLTVVYTLLAARAKSLFAFATSLRAEGAAALALVAGLVLLGRGATPARAILTEAAAATAAALVFVAARPTRLTRRELDPRGTGALLGSVYSVGFLSVLDVVVLRRVEIYFLQHSSSGLAGVAVLGLALQMANMLLLLPSSLLETWQPRLAILFRTDRAAFAGYLRERGRIYARCLAAVCLAALTLPALAVVVVFPKYGPWMGFVVALVAVRVLFAGAGFYSATLYALGLQRWLVAPALGGAAVALAANVGLTLRYGLAGALAAQALTQVTLAGLTILAFRSALRDPAGVPLPAAAPALARPAA